MIRTFRLALAQMNPTVGDIDGNTARIFEYVERARECRADLVAFPELAVTGYPPEDLLFKTSFLQANVDAMRRVVAAAKDIAVVVGYVEVGEFCHRRRHCQRRRRGLRWAAHRHLPQDVPAQLRRL